MKALSTDCSRPLYPAVCPSPTEGLSVVPFLLLLPNLSGAFYPLTALHPLCVPGSASFQTRSVCPLPSACSIAPPPTTRPAAPSILSSGSLAPGPLWSPPDSPADVLSTTGRRPGRPLLLLPAPGSQPGRPAAPPPRSVSSFSLLVFLSLSICLWAGRGSRRHHPPFRPAPLSPLSLECLRLCPPRSTLRVRGQQVERMQRWGCPAGCWWRGRR